MTESLLDESRCPPGGADCAAAKPWSSVAAFSARLDAVRERARDAEDLVARGIGGGCSPS